MRVISGTTMGFEQYKSEVHFSAVFPKTLLTD